MENVKIRISHDCPRCRGTGKTGDSSTACPIKCDRCQGGRIEAEIDLDDLRRLLRDPSDPSRLATATTFPSVTAGLGGQHPDVLNRRREKQSR
jgi:hypothetical protein